jgi:hypothetical protein
MDNDLRRRIRWPNVGRAALVLVAVALIAAWPRLRSAAPAVVPPAPVVRDPVSPTTTQALPAARPVRTIRAAARPATPRPRKAARKPAVRRPPAAVPSRPVPRPAAVAPARAPAPAPAPLPPPDPGAEFEPSP